MYLDELHILNYKNIREAQLHFADKLNCFVGLNGQGKTNILDAIYLLSFTKSAYNAIDSMNITHGEEMGMVQGVYREETLSNSPLKGENKTPSISPLKGENLLKGDFNIVRRDRPSKSPLKGDFIKGDLSIVRRDLIIV